MSIIYVFYNPIYNKNTIYAKCLYFISRGILYIFGGPLFSFCLLAFFLFDLGEHTEKNKVIE